MLTIAWPTYRELIEKAIISLEIKYPDFLLVDDHGYVDICEIKTPATRLLRFDRNHDNHVGSREMSSAVGQVASYLDQTERNSLSICEAIRKKSGLNVRVVRPKGIIIAGSSLELDTETKEDAFRLLNDGLKRIEIVPFDTIAKLLAVRSDPDVAKRTRKPPTATIRR